MAGLPKPLPRFYRFVPRPDTLGDRALAQARPVYIDGLPSYPDLTAAQAQTGTATAASTISAKVLADEIDRRVAAAIAAIPAG